MDFQGSAKAIMRTRMREFADALPVASMDSVKKNLRGLADHYAVRSLPSTVRCVIDGMWENVGKTTIRYILDGCHVDAAVIAEVSDLAVERCPRRDLRLKMRTDILKKALKMTHDEYVCILADPTGCFEWLDAIDPDGLRALVDDWTGSLTITGLGLLDARRARDALLAAEDAEELKKAEERRRDADEKKQLRAKKQFKQAEKQRAARQAKEAKDEKRAAKWRQQQPKQRPKQLEVVWEVHDEADAETAKTAVETAETAVETVETQAQAAKEVIECRVCMDDVVGGAIAMPCGHDQVCDACATALVRDNLLACVQCMEPVCMYISHYGECICTVSTVTTVSTVSTVSC